MNCTISLASIPGHVREPGVQYGQLAFGGWVVDPVVEAAPFERVVYLPCSIACQNDTGRSLGPYGADLRNAHGKVAEHLQQERLELLVGPIDLIDQQHRGDCAPVLERPQQRTPNEKFLAEDVSGGGGLGFSPRFQQPDLHHLSRVVPLIHCGIDIQAFVALKPDELGSEDLGQRASHLGFPDACLALEQERSLQLERQKERRCQVAHRRRSSGRRRLTGAASIESVIRAGPVALQGSAHTAGIGSAFRGPAPRHGPALPEPSAVSRSPVSRRGRIRSAAVAMVNMPHCGSPRSWLSASSASQIIEPGCAGTPCRSTRPPRLRRAAKNGRERVAGRNAPDQNEAGTALRQPVAGGVALISCSEISASLAARTVVPLNREPKASSFIRAPASNLSRSMLVTASVTMAGTSNGSVRPDLQQGFSVFRGDGDTGPYRIGGDEVRGHLHRGDHLTLAAPPGHERG